MRNSKKQRWIKFLTLEATTSGSSSFASMHPFSRTCAAAIEAAIAGESFGRHPKQGAKNHVRLIDIQLDETKKYVAFLFREVDREGQDSCYEDFESGDIKAHPKKPTEGNRATLHLVVRLAGSPSAKGMQHRAVMEVVTGLSSSVIAPRLTGALRPYGTGSGKVLDEDIEYTTIYELMPYVDITILEELKSGVLDQFVLTRPEGTLSGGVDEEPLIRELRSRLELKVVAENRSSVLGRIWDKVRGVARTGGYSLATAFYRTDDGRNASAEVDLGKANALSDLVQRVLRINLSEDVNSDLKKVSWTIANQLIAELEKVDAKSKSKSKAA